MTRLRRPLALVLSLAVTVGGVAACGAGREILGTNTSPCFVALPVARKAVNGRGSLAGVRLVDVSRLPRSDRALRNLLGQLPIPPSHEVCLVAYTGRYAPGQVTLPFGAVPTSGAGRRLPESRLTDHEQRPGLTRADSTHQPGDGLGHAVTLQQPAPDLHLAPPGRDKNDDQPNPNSRNRARTEHSRLSQQESKIGALPGRPAAAGNGYMARHMRARPAAPHHGGAPRRRRVAGRPKSRAALMKSPGDYEPRRCSPRRPPGTRSGTRATQTGQ